jgi:putative methyltransferase (TIGR04325 family)
MKLAPVALFVYNRLDHLKQTIEALQKNLLASETELYIFSDGNNDKNISNSVVKVREYCKKIEGFKSVTIKNRIVNFGLANSIIEGVSSVLKKHERIIVLEDDIITSKYFLKYMNDALEYYELEQKVISVHGYLPSVNLELKSDTFFLKGADCWGWGTWRRGWELFNPNGKALLEKLSNGQISRFNFNNSYDFYGMLKDQISGKNDSWAIRWNASAFIKNKLTLHPSKSLVMNIGNDNSGTHSKSSSEMDTKISDSEISICKIPLEDSKEGVQAFELFYKSNQRRSIKLKVKKKLGKYIKLNFTNIKQNLSKVIPPYLIFVLKKSFFLKKYTIQFNGPYNSWADAENHSTGYSQDKIISKVFKSTLKVIRGEAAYERDSITFTEHKFNWPIISYILKTLSRNSENFSVLDFGGSLGSSYFQNKIFFKELKNFNWMIIEQKKFVELGRGFIENENLKFFSSIEDCISIKKPDVVLASAVLQYLKNPYKKLEELCNIGAKVILLDKIIINKDDKDFIYCQKVPSYIYDATYPVYSLSESKLFNILHKNNYRIHNKFNTLKFNSLRNINSEFKGYAFEKLNK